MLFKNNYLNFEDQKVLKLLKKKEIIAIPTETVYGLFGIVDKDVKIKINNLKKRDPRQALQVFFPNLKAAQPWLQLSKFQKNLLFAELPGKKSFLLKASETKREILNTETILIRIPSQENAPSLIKLLEKSGPLYATSANLHNQSPCRDPKQIRKHLDLKYIIKDKGIRDNYPSKIVSLLDNQIKILRG